MSEKEHSEPQAPTKKWPTPEELAELVDKIPIQEKWLADEKPLTIEILQDVCQRLADETPLSFEEWRNIRNTLYKKINYSPQPEAQRLWELVIERSIDGLSHLIGSETIEKIRKSAEAYEEDSPYRDPRMLWLSGAAKQWHDNIIRMFAKDAGTTLATIEKLAQQLMEQASIPFAKRAKELGISGASIIEDTADRLEFVRAYTNRVQKDQSKIDQHVREILAQI